MLNGTGYRVARLCDGRRSRREIAARISEQYDRSPNGVHDDVRSCLKQLEQAGLLAAGEGEASLPAYPCPTLKGLRLHLKWEFEDRPLAGYLDVRQATWVSGFITLIRLAYPDRWSWVSDQGEE
ncbi:MAG: PqqD family protein [Chloroflexota bacterium]|nr:PqqD family protein [Chloroflexota bacterium]